MKAFNTIVKVLTALAAVAGAIYVAATYGEQIVAWCKKVLSSLSKCPSCEPVCEEEAFEEPAPAAEETEAAAQEPAEAAEAPAEEAVEEAEEPVEEIPLVPTPSAPVAEENDFAE